MTPFTEKGNSLFGNSKSPATKSFKRFDQYY